MSSAIAPNGNSYTPAAPGPNAAAGGGVTPTAPGPNAAAGGGVTPAAPGANAAAGGGVTPAAPGANAPAGGGSGSPSVTVSGTIPAGAKMALLPCSIEGGLQAYSSNGSPTSDELTVYPYVKVLWDPDDLRWSLSYSISFETSMQWAGDEAVLSPELVVVWVAVGGATGIPVFTLTAGVSLPGANAPAGGNVTPAAPGANAPAGGNLTPSAPGANAPAGDSGSLGPEGQVRFTAPSLSLDILLVPSGTINSRPAYSKTGSSSPQPGPWWTISKVNIGPSGKWLMFWVPDGLDLATGSVSMLSDDGANIDLVDALWLDGADVVATPSLSAPSPIAL